MGRAMSRETRQRVHREALWLVWRDMEDLQRRLEQLRAVEAWHAARACEGGSPPRCDDYVI